METQKLTLEIPENITALLSTSTQPTLAKIFNKELNLRAAIEADPNSLPKFDFVLPNFIAGSLGSLISQGGTGKSMLALQIAILISCGVDIGEISPFQPPIGKVIFLPAEDPAVSFIHRLNALGAFLPSDNREILYKNLTIQPLIGNGPNILEDSWLFRLFYLASNHRLMIIDTFRRFHNEDENNSSIMAIVLNRLERIALATDCAIIFLHHSSKSSAINATADQQQAARGSTVLTDNCRWQSFLVKMSESEAKKYNIEDENRHKYLRFGVSKSNFGEPYQEIWLERQQGGVLKKTTLLSPVNPATSKKTKERSNEREDRV
jgi:RecA-family ATPase